MKKLLLLVFIILFGKVAVAAENNGISITPPFIDVTLSEKETQKSLVMELSNNSASALMINLSVVDFGSLDESGGVAFLTSKDEGERKYALASWISLEKDWVLIEPFKNEKVKVTILNKTSLSAGGHYGAVLATVKTDNQADKEIVGLNQSLASLLYVQKIGGEKRNLQLSKFDFDNNFLQFPSNIKIRFQNSGNVHLVPRGKLELKSKWGKVVGKGVLNEASAIIMPESFRLMSLKLKKNSWWVWPGKYQMIMDYRYDGKTEFMTSKYEYYYFGREGVIIYTIVFLAIGFGLYWKRCV